MIGWLKLGSGWIVHQGPYMRPGFFLWLGIPAVWWLVSKRGCLRRKHLGKSCVILYDLGLIVIEHHLLYTLLVKYEPALFKGKGQHLSMGGTSTNLQTIFNFHNLYPGYKIFIFFLSARYIPNLQRATQCLIPF